MFRNDECDQSHSAVSSVNKAKKKKLQEVLRA